MSDRLISCVSFKTKPYLQQNITCILLLARDTDVFRQRTPAVLCRFLVNKVTSTLSVFHLLCVSVRLNKGIKHLQQYFILFFLIIYGYTDAIVVLYIVFIKLVQHIPC